MTEDDLVRCSVPLLWENSDDRFHYTVGATGFLVASCGDFFVITARHNIRGRAIEHLLVPFRAEEREFLTFEAAYIPTTFDGETDTDHSDFVVLKLAQNQTPKDWLVSDQWFDLHFGRHVPTLSEKDCLLTAGFPMSLQTIDYDASHLRRQRLVIGGTYGGSAESSHCHCIQFSEMPNIPRPAVSDEPLSGMSGSPVFAVKPSGKLKAICLAGVMVRATTSSSMGRFIHSSVLWKSLGLIRATQIIPTAVIT